MLWNYIRILLIFLIVLKTSLVLNIAYSQQSKEEELSYKLLYQSINYPKNYIRETIPSNVNNILYFQNKLDIGLYLEYPEYYEDEYYPYSKKIDPETLNLYENYYVVYYDRELKVLREDYYENYKLFYYIFKFYKNNLLYRERITYLKESGKMSVYDYFYYNEESAEVIIKYSEDNIDYINIKLKDKKGYILRSEFYNEDLLRHGIWYYYNEKMLLIKKEYYIEGTLLKYMEIIDLNNIIYYDEEGNVISKAVFDSITD